MAAPAEQVCDLARRLCAVMESGDIAQYSALWHVDAIVWHNYDDLPLPLSQVTADYEGFVAATARRESRDVRIQALPEGFLLRYRLFIANAAGDSAELPVCIVGTVDDRRIRRIDEYVDPAPMFALLGG